MVKIHNTREKIAMHLLDHNNEEFSILSVAKKVSIDYKTVYLNIQELAKEEVITARKAGKTTLVRINQITHPLLYAAECKRRERILLNADLKALWNRVHDNVETPFFILLLFGSMASRSSTKASDIDIMAICDDKRAQEHIKKTMRLIPLRIHLEVFNINEFLSMAQSRNFTVGSEAIKNNVILFGIENYYRLIEHA